MNYTDNEMCTILLSSYIGIEDNTEIKPLSLGEWNRFVDILIKNKLEPSIAYSHEISTLKEFGYDELFIERIKKLVGRGASVAFELEEYENRGINVLTFINKKYPIMLKRQLKNKMPPVLYYSGDISLVNKVGIGVVGSRNITVDGVEFTDKLVKKAAEERLVIFSGGAKGVDMTSQTVAINNGGAVVAYIADSLVSRIKKRDISKNISDGKLLLISDLKPNAGFSAGRAMNRNKLIYASAMGTFVVESEYNKGGTWTGATEAMKNKWGKVLVWNNDIEGNKKLIEQGGIAYDLKSEKLLDVISKQYDSSKEVEYKQISLKDI